MAKTFGHESEGNAVDVTLDYTISGEKAILVDSMVGFPAKSGDSGDTVAIDASRSLYSMQLPAGLTPSVGDRLYVTVASVTEHDIPDAAWSTTSGAGKLLFGFVLSEKDANNYADVKLANFSS